MLQANGYYRLGYGATIVPTIFDYETQTIGPYKCPTRIEYIELAKNYGGITTYDMIAPFVNHKDCIATWHHTRDTVIALCHNKVIHIVPGRKEYTYEFNDYIHWGRSEHIGYVLSYQPIKSIFMRPYYLLRNVNTGELSEKGIALPPAPLQVDPPPTLYSQLVRHTDPTCVAVVQTADGMPVFLHKT